MKPQLEEAELRRYLLGELTLEECVLIEERLFLDDDYMRLGQSVEDELVDEYAHRDLNTAERKRFESHFLTLPEHRDDLKIAQALKRYIDSETGSGKSMPAPVAVSPSVVNPAPGHSGDRRLDKERGLSFPLSLYARRPAIGLSLAAVLLITLSLVAWLIVRTMRRPDGGPPLQTRGHMPTETTPPEHQRAPEGVLPTSGPIDGSVETAGQQGGNQAPADVRSKPADEQAGRHSVRPRNSSPTLRSASTGFATFTILPGGVGRGAGQTGDVSFTPDVRTVILKLPITATEDYDSYRATLRTGGRAKHTWSSLKSETDDELGKVVSLKVPASLLRTGSYEIKLGGLNSTDGQARDITTYSFTVDNK